LAALMGLSVSQRVRIVDRKETSKSNRFHALAQRMLSSRTISKSLWLSL
jgi:hypothetical protein